jgi:Uncharacterized conserved protein (COG2071)
MFRQPPISMMFNNYANHHHKCFWSTDELCGVFNAHFVLPNPISPKGFCGDDNFSSISCAIFIVAYNEKQLCIRVSIFTDEAPYTINFVLPAKVRDPEIMKIPTIHGLIDRRILINFMADPKVVEKILPEPFRPKLYKDKAIVGICLIRLKNIKPKGFPDFLGISSENGAHRIAVEWDEDGQTKQGVFIPRRNTSLKFNTLVGGRIFPSKHYLAKFNVMESDERYHIDFTRSDDTIISIDATKAVSFDTNSIFETLENASDFFEKGELGYSPNKTKFDGLKLQAYNWKVSPLDVSNVQSSFFENEKLFPKGSIKFDNALLMTKIEHEWHSVPDKALLQATRVLQNSGDSISP